MPREQPTEARVVIIADDDNDWRELMAGALRRVGFEVTEAETGVELLTRAHWIAATGRQRFTIVSDIEMPRLNCIHALRSMLALADLATRTLPNAPDAVEAVVAEIAAVQLDDGWVFATAGVEVIREDAANSGVRVTVRATLASARQEFNVDISFGDPIVPAPSTVLLHRILGGAISIMGYPLVMVLAEKLITAVQRGTTNTRWRDYADIYLLSGLHSLPDADLHESLARVS